MSEEAEAKFRAKAINRRNGDGGRHGVTNTLHKKVRIVTRAILSGLRWELLRNQKRY